MCRILESSDQVDLNEVVVTVSTPIIVSQEDKDVVASVLGLQMTYMKFYQIFFNSTRYCSMSQQDGTGDSRQEDLKCNLTCDSDVRIEK